MAPACIEWGPIEIKLPFHITSTKPHCFGCSLQLPQCEPLLLFFVHASSMPYYLPHNYYLPQNTCSTQL